VIFGEQSGIWQCQEGVNTAKMILKYIVPGTGLIDPLDPGTSKLELSEASSCQSTKTAENNWMQWPKTGSKKSHKQHWVCN